MYEVKNELGFNYVTVKVAKSRIDKGLLAIPVLLLDRFPQKQKKISIFFDDRAIPILKNFTPYKSSSRECRIGGLSRKQLTLLAQKENVDYKTVLFNEFLRLNQKPTPKRLRKRPTAVRCKENAPISIKTLLGQIPEEIT
ncbi:MAG: hypothetical protein CVV39_03730 [Planctomycetes bacterium HGW-Planctomycetes-1]|nr:MAG: hypothetical protein CVV39_03730 [Planctomycetes bacterium HGW-Planctomycetes-1]